MVRALHLDEPNGSFRHAVRANPAQTAIAWVIGGLATVAAVVLGSIFALVFAATLAVVLIATVAVLTLMAVVWRVRRPRSVQGPVIEARKIGHSWVAYGWDQNP